MKIQSMVARSFGKLKDIRLDFDAGLNVITGANESGKSSVARFIRFMLYGYTSPRSGQLAENDKKKFTPWDEPVSGGELVLDAGGGTYTLRREQGARASFSTTDSAGEPVFRGVCAGEALLGVNAETFDKTAFIGAGDVFFNDASSLSAAIKNMVFAADSAVDSDAALRRLDALRRSILGKTARTGRLAEARAEHAELLCRQSELKEIHRDLLGAKASYERVSAKLAENRTVVARLEAEFANLDAYRAFCLCRKLEEAEAKVAESRAAYENLRLSLTFDGFMPDRDYLADMNRALIDLSSADGQADAARAALASAEEALRACYGNMKQMKFNSTLDEIGKTPEALSEDMACLQKRRKSYRTWAIVLAVLVITLPAALFFGWRARRIRLQLERLAAQFECAELYELEQLLAGYSASHAAAAKAKTRRDAAENALQAALALRGSRAAKLSDMLDKTGAGVSFTDTSELCTAAGKHIRGLDAQLARAEAAERALVKDVSALDGLAESAGDRGRLEEKAAAYDASRPLREVEKVAKELDFYRRAGEGLAVQEREYEKKAAVLAGNLEKPDELAARISALAAEMEELEQTCAALDMATEAIEKAHEDMRGNVSPVLTRGASELFERMTDGKYKGLYVDNDLSLSFLESGTAEYRSVEYLSSGALDAAYLCLRLTLAKYLYTEPPVLIFDDAFARLDDERLAKACGLLTVLAETHQVIVLSCQMREADLLQPRGAKLLTL